MDRICEPELMEGEQQTLAYARADFSDSNQGFVDGLAAAFPGPLHAVVDLGCGPAEVMLRLARARPALRVTAVDGSAQMIKLAQDAVRTAGLEQQITLLTGYLPGLPLTEHSFDAVLSKDLLHHLPDPAVFWSEAQRLGRPGAAIYVMDLFRPDTPEAARHIVETVAADEHPLLKQDFYNSLCAAFTPDEIEDQLRRADLQLQVTPVSGRHMVIKGQLR